MARYDLVAQYDGLEGLAQDGGTKVVSMFLINCRKMRDVVTDKHARIADQMIELIAKGAKKMANDTMESFDQMNLRIES